jgi:hypothetical protein
VCSLFLLLSFSPSLLLSFFLSLSLLCLSVCVCCDSGFFLSVALYNITAVYLTHLMSSVWHAILDCFRPLSVWGCDLLIFYIISNGTFGEPWTNWSYLELVSKHEYIIIIVSHLLYIKLILSLPSSFIGGYVHLILWYRCF